MTWVWDVFELYYIGVVLYFSVAVIVLATLDMRNDTYYIEEDFLDIAVVPALCWWLIGLTIVVGVLLSALGFAFKAKRGKR